MKVTRRNMLEVPGLADLPPCYTTEETPAEQKIAVVKFFNPMGRGTWYAVEAMAVYDDGRELPVKDADPAQASDVRCFGYVVSILGDDCDEWGYFSLSEFCQVRGIGIEVDRWWKPGRIPELQRTEAA